MEQQNQTAPVMTVREWMLTYLIVIIPIVNIIMLFIWAFSGSTGINPNKINFAKANLIWFSIIFVLYIVIFAFAFLIGIMSNL